MSFANKVYIRVNDATADYSEAGADEKAGHHHLSFSQAAELPIDHEGGTGLQLVQSSRTALINSLNKRAVMINPAGFIYLLGGLALAFGISFVVNSQPNVNDKPQLAIPPLPDVSLLMGGGRNFSQSDEYALLLARYGQPDKVILSRSTPVPLRTAVYDSAHLRIVFVPNGCVEAYYELWQRQTSQAGSKGRASRSHASNTTPKPPPCGPTQHKGSSIVGYMDADRDTPLTSDDAFKRMNRIRLRAPSEPKIELADRSTSRRAHANNGAGSNPISIDFDEDTMHSEQHRIIDAQSAKVQTRDYESGTEIASLGGGLALLAAGVRVQRKCRAKRTTILVYDLSETAKHRETLISQGLTHLSNSQMIWRITARSTTYDWRHDAGASSLIHRKAVTIRKGAPPRVEVDREIHCIDLGTTKFYFLPDFILRSELGHFSPVEYTALRIEQGVTRFVEDESVPSDAQQVSQTWRFVRVDGGPDRRFNNNRPIAVMQYGVLRLSSSNNFDFLFHVSNVQAAVSFSHWWEQARSRRERKEAPEREPMPKPSSPLLNALKMLGLTVGASLTQVSEAYRELAQKYHPDKVANLAPEFQELAERRMKEINGAYALLRRELG